MIDEETWQKLKQLYQQFPEIKGENATDEEIRTAEDVSQLKFSDFYRYFLKNHFVSSINDWELFSLGGSLDSSLKDSVVKVTENFKNENVNKSLEFQGWYIIGKNKNEYIGVNKKGEVWLLQRATEFKKEKISNNFEQFLTQLLNENLVLTS